MSRFAAACVVLCVVAAAPSPAAPLRHTGAEGQAEMVRRERELAATATVRDVERLITKTEWKEGEGLEARMTVQAAGYSGKPEFRPVLKRAAEAWGTANDRTLVFLALHNLWLLGEPPDYFLANVRKHRENMQLATRSALVWGRDATEQTLPELERIRNETVTNSPIWGFAYSNVSFAVHQKGKYAELPSLETKADLVLGWSSAGINGYESRGGDPVDSEDPVAYWARRELLALCKRDPELVARRC